MAQVSSLASTDSVMAAISGNSPSLLLFCFVENVLKTGSFNETKLNELLTRGDPYQLFPHSIALLQNTPLENAKVSAIQVAATITRSNDGNVSTIGAKILEKMLNIPAVKSKFIEKMKETTNTSPVHLASAFGNLSALKVMVAVLGVEIVLESEDYSSQTPLLLAVFGSKHLVVQYLLSNGAIPYRTNKNKSVIDHALDKLKSNTSLNQEGAKLTFTPFLPYYLEDIEELAKQYDIEVSQEIYTYAKKWMEIINSPSTQPFTLTPFVPHGTMTLDTESGKRKISLLEYAIEKKVTQVVNSFLTFRAGLLGDIATDSSKREKLFSYLNSLEFVQRNDNDLYVFFASLDEKHADIFREFIQKKNDPKMNQGLLELFENESWQSEILLEEVEQEPSVNDSSSVNENTAIETNTYWKIILNVMVIILLIIILLIFFFEN